MGPIKTELSSYEVGAKKGQRGMKKEFKKKVLIFSHKIHRNVESHFIDN